jgi:putative toxin-antitoxin system antitoxin component (TIGR02293 family)
MATAKLDIEKKLDKQIAHLIKEAMGMDKLRFINSNEMNLDKFLSNKMLMITIIEHGLPYYFFELLLEYTPFRTENWLEFLDISNKTLNRYKENDKAFKPSQSEKMIEMAEVTHTGLEVFGNMEKLRLWLDTPNFSLGKSKPMDLLKNSYGKDLVLTELTHINHGILA